MAVFCSTHFNFNEFETIKKNNDTVGIVGINDSTPTVIFWKKKLVNENVGANSYTHLFQITRAASSVGSAASSDDASVAAASSIATGSDDNASIGIADANSVAAASSIADANSVAAGSVAAANSVADDSSITDDDDDFESDNNDDFEKDSDSDVSDDAYNTLTITNDDKYLQVQDNSKCAIHALNNLLKGEYFTTVEMTNDETGIINFPEDHEDKPGNVKQKIDLLKKKYYETNNKAGVNLFAVGILLNHYNPNFFGNICGKTSGSSYSIAIISIALNMFGYTTNDINLNHADIFKTLTELRANDNFVGMILNTSSTETGRGGHYIAIRRGNDNNSFILVDSYKNVNQGSPAEAVISDPIPLNNADETKNFISNWLSVNTHYQYISNPVYKVTKNKEDAEQNFNEIIVNASVTEGGRKSSTKKRRRRSASIAHSTNPVVHQRYKTKRRKSPSKPRRKSSTRKRR